MEATITATVYGRTVLPGNWIFQNGDPQKKEPIQLILYHIRIGDRQILIDAGCDTLPGMVVEDFSSPVMALSKNNILAEHITDILITHAHHDHIDGLRHFPNAKIFIQKDEYLAGSGYFLQGSSVHTFEQSCTVAGCIEVEMIGGHSIGSCIAKLEANGKHYVFCGDECYLRVNLQKRIPTARPYCLANSQRFVEEFSDRKYTTLLAHDPLIKNGQIL